LQVARHLLEEQETGRIALRSLRDSPTDMTYEFLTSPMHFTCPTHLASHYQRVSLVPGRRFSMKLPLKAPPHHTARCVRYGRHQVPNCSCEGSCGAAPAFLHKRESDVTKHVLPLRLASIEQELLFPMSFS
jgi:hypothetical protein